MAVGVKWDPLGFFPVFGIFGGTIGGMAAGMIQVFSWKIPRSLNYFLFIILIISLVIQLILGYSLWLIFVPILGMVYSLIVFAVTIAICAQLKKSPVNWWLFYLILVIGVIISIVSMGFFTTFSDGFLSQ
jgi:predicted ferric reductase